MIFPSTQNSNSSSRYNMKLDSFNISKSQFEKEAENGQHLGDRNIRESRKVLFNILNDIPSNLPSFEPSKESPAFRQIKRERINNKNKYSSFFENLTGKKDSTLSKNRELEPESNKLHYDSYFNERN